MAVMNHVKFDMETVHNHTYKVYKIFPSQQLRTWWWCKNFTLCL